MSDTKQWSVRRAHVEPEQLSGRREADQAILLMRFNTSKYYPRVNGVQVQRAALLLRWMVSITLTKRVYVLTLKSMQCAFHPDAIRQLSSPSHVSNFQTMSSADVLSSLRIVCRRSLQEKVI